jgi:hypothetical protein
VEPTACPITETLAAAQVHGMVWLFGGWAERQERSESALDLQVVMPKWRPPEVVDSNADWKSFGQDSVPVDIVPCIQSEFDEEHLTADSLPMAAREPGSGACMSVPGWVAGLLDPAEADM